MRAFNNIENPVVNCFQNTNFSDDSQEFSPEEIEKLSCELLSEY